MNIHNYQLYHIIYGWLQIYKITSSCTTVKRINNTIQFLPTNHKPTFHRFTNVFNENNNIFKYHGYDYHYLELVYNLYNAKAQ